MTRMRQGRVKIPGVFQMRLDRQILLDSTRAMWHSTLDLVYPRHCESCHGAVLDEARHLCWDCMTRMQFIQRPHCDRCGDPIEGKVDYDPMCAYCSRHRIWFTRARSAVRYRGPIRDVIQSFKYKNALYLGRDMNLLLLACVQAHYGAIPFDAVTSVPLFARRERERTYNQAAVLARDLASDLRSPYDNRLVIRIRDTQTQTHLSAPERRENMAGAFVPHGSNGRQGQRLLLVDDVMTTGATVNECARALKEAGAEYVYVATVARG